jgi:DNA replication protein DnaC
MKKNLTDEDICKEFGIDISEYNDMSIIDRAKLLKRLTIQLEEDINNNSKDRLFDFHGLTEDDAYNKLKEICETYNTKDTIVIITGKSGIIKQNISKWLEGSLIEYVHTWGFNTFNDGELFLNLKRKN